MKVIDNGGGIGQEKHLKLQEHLEEYKISSLDLVLKRFEAKTYRQELLYVYRNSNEEYLFINSVVEYNGYLNYLDWKNGTIKLNDGQIVEYEHDVETFCLSIDVIEVLAGDSIGWLGEIIKRLRNDAPLSDYWSPNDHEV
ncbi:MAG: hypothetical protein K6T85_19060 [Gorillibacterium sp.]|nr:hypothetical protein [Gorillibacterium sp.]